MARSLRCDCDEISHVEVLKFWFYCSLFAKLISGNAIQLFLAFDRHCLAAVGVDGVLPSFTHQVKSVLFKVSN